eukprot:scaffold117574_cov32-Tisochrysis_lutea.AAC.2
MVVSICDPQAGSCAALSRCTRLMGVPEIADVVLTFKKAHVDRPMHVLDLLKCRMRLAVREYEAINAKLRVVPFAIKVPAVRPKVAAGGRIYLMQALVCPVPDETTLSIGK